MSDDNSTPNLEDSESVWEYQDYINGLCRHSEIGRLRPDPFLARRMAQKIAPMAMRALADVAANSTDNPNARVKAANAILDRGYGRPELPIQATGGGFTPSPEILEEMPWISPNRLSYKRGAVIAQDILDKKTGETKFVGVEISGKAEAEPDPLPAEPAADGPEAAAQAISEEAKGVVPTEPETRSAARYSRSEDKPNLRRDCGPRGNARHK